MKSRQDFLQNYKIRLEIFSKRILISIQISSLLLIVLIYNLYNLQITNFNKYNIRAKKNYTKNLYVEPSRGFIYDRNGVPLAINKINYQLEVIPNNIKNISKTVTDLYKIIKFNNSKENIITFLEKKKKHDQFIPVVLKTNLTDIEIAKFSINRYKLSGVYLQIYQKRFYPYKNAFSHVIGYVSIISSKDVKNLKKKNISNRYFSNVLIGKTGIEKYYEHFLHGEKGHKKVAINSKGDIIYTIYKKKPYSGHDIYLTIDLKLQKYIYSLMADSRSAVIISNPKNGNILAMVSTPSFNPNIFINGLNRKNLNILLNNPNKPLINRTIQGIYPPASTIKPYLSLTALKLNLIGKNTILFDPGWWKIPKTNKSYKDWKKNGHGYLNVIKALQESSDSFFYRIAYDLGINKIHDWMVKFGYGQLTNIDLYNEKLGNMPTKKWKIKNIQAPWYIGDTISVGIGQSYWNATPIQMHNALIILINNGVLSRLHLLKKIIASNNVYYYKPKHQKIISTPINIWNIIKHGMYNVANKKKGTMYTYLHSTKNYKIAAKTGTAQVFSLKNKKIYNINTIEERLRDHKLVIAFAPFNNPIIAMTIIIENNNSHKILIGVTTRKIFDYILKKK
ncbi:penicillin-binding protein 2 [Enterobacteriaceae endosymbiont of Donacia tomentosa]|uniref:penicillin-binding protein 2 n=1 Tax=Enterobacteriaceae endosymbiont of Donacia tomentosa TaxID=2675787 RepID=UPI001448F097|nr:penicillin-binding protein 2 [Enterobacteriaceae endosymbiont of Donacia tomentosa]QJC31728.1 penicillin-binding protein 2 [Enterobacteriaceae endosymbiont of Donacia tomentosa]